MNHERAPRVLIIVENLSVPFDRRVWQESRALADAGYDVTVICPMGNRQDTEPATTIDGVRILRYPLRPAAGGPRGYVREYVTALWHSMRLSVAVRRHGPVDVVHACNPPDILFLAALPLKLAGARFIFDHHDLVPELYQSRFAGAGRLLYRAVLLVERLTFAVADGVISTNESYREVALGRGKVAPDRVTVVRSAPDLARFVRREPDPQLRRERAHLVAYLGVMGPQDGVDHALRALQYLRQVLGREDVHAIFMGSGDAFDDMVALSDRLGISDFVEFTGRVPDEFVQRCLSTADVCLSPDPRNPLNDVSTMNKVVEYMAMGCPVVSFELVEARVSAGPAAVYAPANDDAAFAELVDELLDDPVRRRAMGEAGRRRVERDLSWSTSSRNLIEFYARVLQGAPPSARRRRSDVMETHPRSDEDTHAGARHFCEVLEASGELGPTSRILAAGCGPAHEALYIHGRLGGEMVGVDIGVEWEPGLDGELTLVDASVLDLPFADKSFDAVFYHHVIEHVSDPPASLAELARVLRPGGLLYVGTPNRHRVLGYVGSFETGLMDKLRWNAADYRARFSGRFRNELGAHAGFSESELKRLLESDFVDVRSLTTDYLRFKYGSRVPSAMLRAVTRRPVSRIAAPSVYALARR